MEPVEQKPFEQNNEQEKNDIKECDFCDKAFNDSKNMDNHIKTVHEKSLLHICIFCSKNLKEFEKLKDHVVKSHNNLKKFSCAFCKNIKFRKQWTTTQHHRNELTLFTSNGKTPLIKIKISRNLII